jgi:hypothetical protein
MKSDYFSTGRNRFIRRINQISEPMISNLRHFTDFFYVSSAKAWTLMHILHHCRQEARNGEKERQSGWRRVGPEGGE